MVGCTTSPKTTAAALLLLVCIANLTAPSQAGIFSAFASYGACQTGCNTAWVSCYAAAGLVAGTVTAGAAIPAAAAACNTAQGVCMAACAKMAGIALFTNFF